MKTQIGDSMSPSSLRLLIVFVTLWMTAPGVDCHVDTSRNLRLTAGGTFSSHDSTKAESGSFLPLQGPPKYLRSLQEKDDLLEVAQLHKQPRQQQQQQENPSFEVRYLSLGGPSTWGVGLDSPHPIRTNVDETSISTAAATSNITTTTMMMMTHDPAYPYRLSIEAHNVAQRVGGGSTLAALCTQSLVGEEIYDVITIEFSNFHGNSDLLATEFLLKRLRRRFPNAVILLVQLWSPSHFFYSVTNDHQSSVIDFASWRKGRRNGTEWNWKNSTEWQEALTEHEWKYSSKVLHASDRLQDLVEQFDGHFVHLAPPKDAIFGLGTANKWFLELDRPDDTLVEYTLSAKGHAVVATHIRSLVEQEHISKKSMEERNTTGDWGSGDACHLWYDYDPDGIENDGFTQIPTYSVNLLVQKEANGSYVALEIPPEGGSIVVQNPFQEDRMLSLTYEVDDRSSPGIKRYPRVQTWLDGTKGMVINPNSEGDVTVGQVQTTRTSPVGLVEAYSYVEIRFNPLEDTSSRFRLVGTSFLAKNEAQWKAGEEIDLLAMASSE